MVEIKIMNIVKRCIFRHHSHFVFVCTIFISVVLSKVQYLSTGFFLTIFSNFMTRRTELVIAYITVAEIRYNWPSIKDHWSLRWAVHFIPISYEMCLTLNSFEKSWTLCNSLKKKYMRRKSNRNEKQFQLRHIFARL